MRHDHGPGGDVLADHSTPADHRPGADAHAVLNDHARADPHIVLDHHRAFRVQALIHHGRPEILRVISPPAHVALGGGHDGPAQPEAPPPAELTLAADHAPIADLNPRRLGLDDAVAGNHDVIPDAQPGLAGPFGV